MNPFKPDEESFDDLNKIIERGARVRSFLNGDLWRDDLGPVSAQIQEEALGQIGYQPGSNKSVDQTALDTAYYSALADRESEFLKRLNRLVKDGEEAAKRLKLKEKK